MYIVEFGEYYQLIGKCVCLCVYADVDVCVRIGKIRNETGDYDSAIHYASEALSMEPFNFDARSVMLSATTSLATLLYDKGRMHFGGTTVLNDKRSNVSSENSDIEALKVCRDAIQCNPSYALSYYLIGNILERQSKYKEAIEAQRLAVKFSEINGVFQVCKGVEYAEAQMALAVALEAEQRSLEAVEHYTMAVQFLPGGSSRHIDAQLCLADALLVSIDDEDAPPFLELDSHNQSEAEGVDSFLSRAEIAYGFVNDNATVASELAHAAFGTSCVQLRRRNDLNKAIQSLRRAVSLEPGNARYWHALGCAVESLARRTNLGQEAKSLSDEYVKVSNISNYYTFPYRLLNN